MALKMAGASHFLRASRANLRKLAQMQKRPSKECVAEDYERQRKEDRKTSWKIN
jgi:hypothetical protein